MGVELEEACCTVCFKHHEEWLGSTEREIDWGVPKSSYLVQIVDHVVLSGSLFYCSQ